MATRRRRRYASAAASSPFGCYSASSMTTEPIRWELLVQPAWWRRWAIGRRWVWYGRGYRAGVTAAERFHQQEWQRQ